MKKIVVFSKIIKINENEKSIIAENKISVFDRELYNIKKLYGGDKNGKI